MEGIVGIFCISMMKCIALQFKNEVEGFKMKQVYINRRLFEAKDSRPFVKNRCMYLDALFIKILDCVDCLKC